MQVEYTRSISPPAPFLPVQVADPARRNIQESLSAKLDTAADITALPLDMVQKLGLTQIYSLEVAGFDQLAPILIPVYEVILEIAHIRVRLGVLPHNETYALLGRDVVNHLRLLLDGPALRLEVYK